VSQQLQHCPSGEEGTCSSVSSTFQLEPAAVSALYCLYCLYCLYWLAAAPADLRVVALLQERIAEFESAAVGDKPWHLVGEVSAAGRPMNSALEIDMEYDTTNKLPPAPTEAATQSLEDVIKRRIAEQR
jgi:hypothetical protein